MRRIFYINSLVGILFGLSWLLAQVNFSYHLLYLTGLMFFFLPGLNLSYTLEQITETQGQIKLYLWTFVFSIIFSPTFVWAYLILNSSLITTNLLLGAFVTLWIISIIIISFFTFWKKAPSTKLTLPSFNAAKGFYISLLILLAALFVHFVLYPLIPEADPYSYLTQMRFVENYHAMPPSEARPVFITLISLISALTEITPYWLFKLILPLSIVPILLVFYARAKKVLTRPLEQVVASLSFLLFPVIILEFITPRPQSIFLVGFPIILYLLTELISYKRYINYYWIFVLIVLSIFGIKIHYFFIFSLIISTVGLILFSLPLIKKYPLEFVLAILAICLSAYPWLNQGGLITVGQSFIGPFANSLAHPNFDLWFIDKYTNVDGNQAGWPGISTLYYYGYNLGLAFPLLFLWSIFKCKGYKRLPNNNSIYWTALIIFLAIAEFFPRLGLAYLPDRAWLFISLILSLIMTSFWVYFFKKMPRCGVVIALGLLIISILIGWFITYSKQGWVSLREYRFAKEVQAITPENSLIISQGANTAMINYFAQRKLIIPDKFFFQDPKDLTELGFIQKLSPRPIRETPVIDDRKSIEENIRNEVRKYQTLTKESEKLAILNNISALTKKYEATNNEINKAKPEKPNRPDKIYVLYSNDKFNNLYSSRQWWLDMNFKNVRLEQFDGPYHLVAKQGDIYLWEVDKSVWY